MYYDDTISIIITTNNIISIIAAIAAHGNHNGLSTQSQFHDILPMSFNTINTIVNRPVKPPPILIVIFLFELLLSFNSTPRPLNRI